MRNYFSINHLTAGFLAVLIGFSSSAALIFQAVSVMGGSTVESSSWIFALGVGVSFGCIFLSCYYHMPILAAWSTPGAALLVTNLPGVSLAQAVGAFIFTGVLTLILGATGLFEKITSHIPRNLASAMLAGILLHFGVNVFIAMQDQRLLVIAMLMAYLISKRFWPRFTLLIVLFIGIALAAFEGLIHLQNFHFTLASPVFTKPEFSWSVMLSVGLPLFIITMTSQNIPGLTVLQTAGYNPPASRLLSLFGLTTLIMAPFGGFSYNLAAITAAICANEEADENPTKRYRATICAGFFYLLLGVLGATIVALFTSFPNALILAIAGFALFGTLATNLKEALEDDKQRESALITFLIAASGINLFGISAAFWGLLLGILSIKVLSIKQHAEEPLHNIQ